MRFMAWNVGLSAWLIVTSFAFPQSGTSFILAWATALLVSVISVAAGTRADLRMINSLASFVLFWSALLLPDLSVAARISNGIVGAILFALSLVRSPRTGPQVPAP
jgi:hypothetical protein